MSSDPLQAAVRHLRARAAALPAAEADQVALQEAFADLLEGHARRAADDPGAVRHPSYAGAVEFARRYLHTVGVRAADVAPADNSS